MSIGELNRRAVVAGLAAAPASGLPVVSGVAASVPDPVIAAIAHMKRLEDLMCEAQCKLDAAELRAAKEFGRRPFPLVAWRNYGAIGGSELESARDEFLRKPGANPTQIEEEYQDAKKRERDLKRAGPIWDKRVGVLEIRAAAERAHRDYCDAWSVLSNMKPTTHAGAARMVILAKTEIEEGGPCEWHWQTLETVAETLNEWGASS